MSSPKSRLRRQHRARRNRPYVVSLTAMQNSSTLRELWDTTRMRLLVEVERQGSLSGAARAIGIGQPSASQHLRLLEAAAGQLLAGRVQLALVGVDAADDRVRLEPFLEDELVGICKPGSLRLRNGKLDPKELAALLLLAREADSSTQNLVDRELAEIGVEPAGRWELGSSEAIKRAAREGLGVAILSRYAVAEEVEARQLEAFRLAGRPPLRRRFSTAHLQGRPLAPSERGFLATLTRCCAKSADYAASCVGVPA